MGRSLIGGVNDLKAKFDVKLAEMSSLITDLGSLPHTFGRTNSQRLHSVPPGLRSAGPPHRTTASENSDVVDDRRLSVIHEYEPYTANFLE